MKPGRVPAIPREPLETRLARMGLKTNSILGDDNCFYRSVSYALYGEQTFHEELRQDTIAYMANNFEKFQVYHGEYMSDMPI